MAKTPARHRSERTRGTLSYVKLGPKLSRAFFQRPCLVVAPELLGLMLVRRQPRGPALVGRIVEVEAYLGEGCDPASHAHRGSTPRNRAMFGAAGRLYVYRSYGIHLCANVVCEAAGSGAAVLLRAVGPVAGSEQMKRNRGLAPEAEDALIASGPGRLTQAFDIRHEDDSTSLLRGPISIHRPAVESGPSQYVACPRIGITKATERLYRYCAVPPRHLSKPIPTSHAAGSGAPVRRTAKPDPSR